MSIDLDSKNLKHFKGVDLKDVEKELRNAHEYLMSEKSGTLGYLYQAQVRRSKLSSRDLNELRENKGFSRITDIHIYERNIENDLREGVLCYKLVALEPEVHFNRLFRKDDLSEI